MSTKEREIVAYHESGHAIVATVLPGLDPVHKISIVQRGFGALGYTMQLPLEDRYLMTRQRSAQPAGGAARRPHRRRDRARRDLDRRAERPAARHRHRPRDGHRVRHERRARRDQLRRQQARALPRHPDAAGARPVRRGDRADRSTPRSSASSTDAHDTARRILTDHRDEARNRHAPAARGRGDGRRRAARAARRSTRAVAVGHSDGRRRRAADPNFGDSEFRIRPLATRHRVDAARRPSRNATRSATHRHLHAERPAPRTPASRRLPEQRRQRRRRRCRRRSSSVEYRPTASPRSSLA